MNERFLDFRTPLRNHHTTTCQCLRMVCKSLSISLSLSFSRFFLADRTTDDTCKNIEYLCTQRMS